MKPTIVILLILVIILSFLQFKDCSGEHRTNTDSLELARERNEFKAREKEWEAEVYKLMYKRQDSTREVVRIKWLAAKTLKVPAGCDSVRTILVNACDSLHKQDSIGIALRDHALALKDTALHYWHNTHANDSTLVVAVKQAIVDTVKYKDKEIGKYKRKTFWANVRTALVGGAWVTREIVSK